MKTNKIKVGLIFGGKSGEHEVSLVSARSIFNALDKKKYEVKLIGIDKKGIFRLGESKDFWLNPENTKKITLNKQKSEEIIFSGNVLKALKNGKNITEIDVFFPVTHGTFGEDGCLQGLLECMNAAYVGSGVLGSAVGMDKDVMKRLFRDSEIPTARFYAPKKSEINQKFLNKVIKDLKFPIFVKPANLGSSVGISKAKNKKELEIAIDEAFKYDTKIIIEEYIKGREIECSILGNDSSAGELIASKPGEIKFKSDFYSYDAKYINENDAIPVPVADLPKNIVKKIQQTAIKVFKVLECSGMGRVDFFLTKKGKIYANEINTLPGFTSISMFPKMFAESGISYSKLLDKLIELAIEKKKERDKLKRIFG